MMVSTLAPTLFTRTRARVLPLIAGGSGTQLAAACGRCSAVATAKPVLCETAAVEFTGFEQARPSWVLPQVSSRQQLPPEGPTHETDDTFLLLGATRFPEDKNGVIKGTPRHPIVEDDVVIYAGATILGRITIGKGSVISGNVWLTHSVPPGSNVLQAQMRNTTVEPKHLIEAVYQPRI